MAYPNPKLPNNAHNVPVFGNWAGNSMKRRVVDPIHGEKFIYPNEYDFKAGFGELKFSDKNYIFKRKVFITVFLSKVRLQ